MKKYLAIALLAIACGAAEDQDAPDLDTAGDEIDVGTTGSDIGTAEEAISIGTGGNGFEVAARGLACAQPGIAGQNCFMSAVQSGTVNYCFNSASPVLTAAAKTGIREGIAAVDPAAHNWTFHEVASGSTCKLEFRGTLSDPTGPTLASNIDDFATWSPSGNTFLTSPAGTGHVNGTWFGFTSLIVRYNTAKALAQGLGLDRIYGRHLGGNAAGRFMGLGSRDSGNYSFTYMRRFVSVATDFTTVLTTGDRCRVDSLNTTSATTISAVTSCGI